jgi:hypothetical protein
MKIILSILYFFVHGILFAQRTIPLPIYFMMFSSAHKPIRAIPYSSHYGVLTLQDGNNISGNFIYDIWEFPRRNFIDKATKVHYPINKIKSIKFERTDTLVYNIKSNTVFQYLPSINKMGRLLVDGKIQVFDLLLIVDEIPGAISKQLIIQDRGIYFNIETYRKWQKWQKWSNHYLLMSKDDFNPQNVLRCIRDKNNVISANSTDNK